MLVNWDENRVERVACSGLKFGLVRLNAAHWLMWPVSPFTFLPDCSSPVPTESWVYRAQQRYWRSLRVHQIRWQHALAYHLVTDLQGTCCRTRCLSNWYELIREAVQEAWEKLGCHDLEYTDQGEGLNAILEISLTQLNPVRYKWLLFPLNFSVSCSLPPCPQERIRALWAQLHRHTFS